MTISKGFYSPRIAMPDFGIAILAEMRNRFPWEFIRKIKEREYPRIAMLDKLVGIY
jgi:hypothetical protein